MLLYEKFYEVFINAFIINRTKSTHTILVCCVKFLKKVAIVENTNYEQLKLKFFCLNRNSNCL